MQLDRAACGELVIVSDQYQRGAVLAVEIEQEINDSLAGAGIQVSSGFVGKKDVWGGDEGAGNRDPLLFAARQLVRIVIEAGTKADTLQQ